MSCVLRIGGESFDVDGFIKNIGLTVDSVWRKGERKFAHGNTNRSLHDTSGVRIIVSNAEMPGLAQQITEATEYIRTNSDHLTAVRAFPGVVWADLDFGTEIHPPGWSSFSFPPELLSLAGATGVSLCLSVYPTQFEVDSDG